MKCTNEQIGQMIALYEFGALDKRGETAVLNHLVECEYCYSQVYSLEPAMMAFRKHRADAMRKMAGARRETNPLASLPKRPGAWHTWHGIPALAALCLLIVALAGAVFIATREPKPKGLDTGDRGRTAASRDFWKDLAIPKAAYPEKSSSLRLRGPGEAFARAMEAYQASNFPSAIEQLGTLQELAPSNAGEVNFYLGVSLLMIDKPEESRPPLKRAVEQSDGDRREAADYYLALAFAKDGKLQEAVLELNRVVEMNGEHQAAARSLLERMAEATK